MEIYGQPGKSMASQEGHAPWLAIDFHRFVPTHTPLSPLVQISDGDYADLAGAGVVIIELTA